jgi:hypothetical protein
VTPHSRRKGVRGEREVAIAFEQAGATRLHNLEGQGDHLVELDDYLFHVEVKRRERLAIMDWVRQAEAEADPRMIPLVVFRQSGQPWRVVLQLDQFIGVVGGT